MLKAHKPDMIAAWAKENKIKNWEHYYRAYDSKEGNNRRQNFRRNSNEQNRQTYKKGL